MHNYTKGTLWYTIDYVKYLSIYLKGTWKDVLYTNKYMEEPLDPQDVVQETHDNSYI